MWHWGWGGVWFVEGWNAAGRQLYNNTRQPRRLPAVGFECAPSRVLCVCVPVPQVGPTEHAICALSGGVDSTVAATLVHRVLGDRLHCVFVDHGLLRYKVGGGCWGEVGGRVVLCGGRTRRGEREGSWGNDGGGVTGMLCGAAWVEGLRGCAGALGAVACVESGTPSLHLDINMTASACVCMPALCAVLPRPRVCPPPPSRRVSV